MDFKSKGVMPSSPGEESVGREDIKSQTDSGEHRRASGVGKESGGGGGRSEGSLVKNLEKVLLRRVALLS